MRLKLILFIKKLLGNKVWGFVLKTKNHFLFLLHPMQYKSIKKRFLDTLTPETIFLIGTPRHGNVGDQAIVVASLHFLTIQGFSNIYEIPTTEYYLTKRLLKRYGKKHTFCLHGGGNMGIDYFGNEFIRRDIMKSFPNNKLVIFPQTLDYGNTAKGQTELENSIKIYNVHPNLSIFARETFSYENMKKYYTESSVFLVPDIVLSWKPILPQKERAGVLFCLRHDKESIFTPSDRHNIRIQVEAIFPEIQDTDTWTSQTVSTERRENYVLDKLKEFRSAKLVVTDRLHGMIFAAITETPCIVFPNYNHKIRYEYKWLTNLAFITFLEDTNGFSALLQKYNNTICNSSHSFNNYDAEFKSLADVLKAD